MMGKLEAKNIYDVRVEMDLIKDSLSDLGIRKREVELEIATLNNKVRTSGYLPKNEYLKICSRQREARDKIIPIEKDIREKKKEYRQWLSIFQELDSIDRSSRNQNSENIEPDQDALTALRNRYLDFAEDQSRISSMRVMAAQFANELTTILSRG